MSIPQEKPYRLVNKATQLVLTPYYDTLEEAQGQLATDSCRAKYEIRCYNGLSFQYCPYSGGSVVSEADPVLFKPRSFDSFGNDLRGPQ